MNNIRLLPSLMVFSEVVKYQSFTLAAKALKMSKSAVSQHIKRLEADIGHQLLLRNTRAMTLTTAGTRLLKRSDLLKSQLDLAIQEISTAEQEPSGIFSVTFPHSFEPEIISPSLYQLCTEFNGLQPHLTVTDEPLDLINEGLDVAIFAGHLPDSNYRALPIGILTESLCASPEYLHKYGTPSCPKDLSNHRWIAAHWQKSPLTLFKTSAPDTPIAQIDMQPYGKSNSLSGVIEMTKRGMGLAFLPEITRHPLIQQGSLAPILDAYQGQEWPIHFVHPYRGEKPRHVTRFYQLIRHYFDRAKLKT